jgi:DNA polymerase III delta prime subunit
MQAMEPAKKKEVMEDLDAFRNGKDYHASIGKAWKRDYLLYGPPGTGKSTMVAAMVNYLHYDVYDLELTSVHTNTDLCKLFIGTINKSIIIEDIDCSLDLTGKRKRKKKTDSTDTSNNKDGPLGPPSPKEDKSDSKVTLSGMLNFIDDLWSGSGVERIILYVHHQPH